MSDRRHCLIFVVVVFFFLLPAIAVKAAEPQVVTFGADLTKAQKSMLASEFGVNLGTAGIPVVEVTNSEERQYLEGLVPEDVLGNRAISSALVEILPANQGVLVETRNITWVTDDMYANALVTAGVRDARIKVTAPFPVSGTAALTGVFKGVEHATGNSLGEQSKKVANEELVRTGNLGQEIGKDRAARLILLVKERVIAEQVTDPDRIRQIIINVAGDLNINLNDRQIDDIIALMQKIKGLDIRLKDLSDQLVGLKTGIEKTITEQQPEVKNWLQRLLDVISRLVEQVRALILGEG